MTRTHQKADLAWHKFAAPSINHLWELITILHRQEELRKIKVCDHYGSIDFFSPIGERESLGINVRLITKAIKNKVGKKGIDCLSKLIVDISRAAQSSGIVFTNVICGIKLSKLAFSCESVLEEETFNKFCSALKEEIKHEILEIEGARKKLSRAEREIISSAKTHIQTKAAAR